MASKEDAVVSRHKATAKAYLKYTLRTAALPVSLCMEVILIQKSCLVNLDNEAIAGYTTNVVASLETCRSGTKEVMLMSDSIRMGVAGSVAS